MSVTAGDRLGPYEIVAPLGAGGMGEVYRATDTRLDRSVAVKVLTQRVAASPEARERFEREARAVAALSHPHICTLHDIGNQDGTDYLVMELLGGESLAARLERGALPLDEALSIGIAVADALDAAHRQGIVHRDLKPGNVMLTPDGVKLLDFGLAKLGDGKQETDAGEAPTRTAALTAEGTILGTLNYMSPEQLDGKPSDVRSDVFAFGATLYEMITGRRAFEGAGQASIISAVIKDQPPAIAEVQPLAPTTLGRLVETCLAKDPDDRWQTVRDLKRELRWVAQTDSSEAHAVESAAQSAPSRPWFAGSVAAAAIIAAAAGWALKPAPVLPAPDVQRFVIDAPAGHRVTRPFGVSPDGSVVVYGAGDGEVDRLYARPLDSFYTTPVAGSEGIGGDFLFFSPDSRHVAFLTREDDGSTLYRLSLAGGGRLPIAEIGSGLRGAAWLPDDTLVLGGLRTGLRRVPANGGTPEPLTTLDDGEFAHIYPVAIPGRDEILFTVVPNARNDREALASAWSAVYSPANGDTSRLLDGSVGAYIESGHLLYQRGAGGEGVYLVEFDPGELRVTGDPVPYQTWANELLDTGESLAGAALSRTGVLAYLRRAAGSELRTLAWVDHSGREEPLPLDPAVYRIVRVSPDGDRIALDRRDDPLDVGSNNVWVFDRERSNLSPLVRDEHYNHYPLWSADGETIAFTSARDGPREIYARAADGTGPIHRLTDDDISQWPLAWSADGRTMAVVAQLTPGGQGPFDIHLLSLDGDDPNGRPLFDSQASEGQPDLSPDGRWIAYRSDESGRDEVYVQRFPELGGRIKISTDGGTSPRWSPDGAELYYRSGSAMMAVTIGNAGAPLDVGVPRLLFDGPYLNDSGRNYDIAPDGRFLMVRLADDANLTQVHVVVNWLAELQAMLPSR